LFYLLNKLKDIIYFSRLGGLDETFF